MRRQKMSRTRSVWRYRQATCCPFVRDTPVAHEIPGIYEWSGGVARTRRYVRPLQNQKRPCVSNHISGKTPHPSGPPAREGEEPERITCVHKWEMGVAASTPRCKPGVRGSLGTIVATRMDGRSCSRAEWGGGRRGGFGFRT